MGVLNPATSPKLGFKLGLQSAMDTMLNNGSSAGATHGTFYLTQDTHRLYIGNSDGSVSAVNEGVITVARLEDLPDPSSAAHAGEFYYITGGSAANVLCVCSGGKWVQINNISKLESFAATVDTTSGTSTVEFAVRDTAASTALKDSFSITGAGGNTVSSSGKAITITGNTGSLSFEQNGAAGSNKVNLKLTNSNASDSTIEIDGNSNTTVSVSSGKLVIAGTDTTTNSVSVDNATNGFTVSVTDTKGATKTSPAYDPIITYGNNGSSTAHFQSGNATLNVYTTTQVDDIINSQMRGLNAMTYKGTTTYANLPAATDGVAIGDTWVLSEATNIGNRTYPAGTILIANGTEDANGHITSATLTWDKVDGSGTDSQYRLDQITHGVELKNTTTNATVGSFALAVGNNDAITLADSGVGNNRIVTIGHATITRAADTAGTAYTCPNNGQQAFDCITGITQDAFGHVTGLTVSTITMKNTQGDLSAGTATATTSNNQTTVGLQYTLTRSDGSTSSASNSFNITSESLTLGNNGASVNINLVWGSFGS